MSHPSYEAIELEISNGAAIVRLDRTEKLNALSTELLAELRDTMSRTEEMDDVRVVVLTGKGRSFSTGFDFGDHNDRQEKPVEFWLDKDYSHIEQIYNHDKPVIAAVNGYALAMGCNIALVCDLTIASESAEFGFPDIHMGGLPPRFILPFVTNSLKHARELLYTGKRIDADRAEQIGIVNRTVPDDELMDAVWTEIENIKKTPGTTASLLKSMLNDAQNSAGYRPTGKLDEYLFCLSEETAPVNKFDDIVDTEGINAAIEWMNETDKE